MPRHIGETSLTKVFELIEDKFNLLKAENAALEKRVKALEDALGGFSFRGASSPPTSADENTITIVDV